MVSTRRWGTKLAGNASLAPRVCNLHQTVIGGSCLGSIVPPSGQFLASRAANSMISTGFTLSM